MKRPSSGPPKVGHLPEEQPASQGENRHVAATPSEEEQSKRIGLNQDEQSQRYRLAEANMRHHHEMEKMWRMALIADMAAQRVESARGQTFALVAVGSVLCTSILFGLMGLELSAGIVGGGGLAALATAFLGSRRSSTGALPPRDGEG